MKQDVNVRTRKRKHVDAVKAINTKKSALSQHVVDFHHGIDWKNAKILKSDAPDFAENFQINQKARSLNAINHNDGANILAVYSVSNPNK